MNASDASLVMTAISDWSAGDGTPVDNASPYPDVVRVLFEGLTWLADDQPHDAMVTRAGIETIGVHGPGVRISVFFDLDPHAPARVMFATVGDPAPRIADHTAARLAASLARLTTIRDTARPPYLPGSRRDLVTHGTSAKAGASLNTAYRRCVNADTTPRLAADFEARAHRGRPDDREAAAAAIHRLGVPDGWTVRPSLLWITHATGGAL